MPPVLQKPEIRTEWFEEICQQLDDLRNDARNYADETDTIPEDGFFEKVKQAIQDLRRLAGFPIGLPIAHVWLGPEGQVGITWKNSTVSLDLIFGYKFTARRTRLGQQEVLKTQDVPPALAELAAA